MIIQIVCTSLLPDLFYSHLGFNYDTVIAIKNPSKPRMYCFTNRRRVGNSDTPNRGYNKPDMGEEDWHLPLDENFERFEEDVQSSFRPIAKISTNLSDIDRVIVPEPGDDI